MMNPLKSKKSNRPGELRDREEERYRKSMASISLYNTIHLHFKYPCTQSPLHILGVSKQIRGELLYLWKAGMATLLISHHTCYFDCCTTTFVIWLVMRLKVVCLLTLDVW